MAMSNRSATGSEYIHGVLRATFGAFASGRGADRAPWRSGRQEAANSEETAERADRDPANQQHDQERDRVAGVERHAEEVALRRLDEETVGAEDDGPGEDRGQQPSEHPFEDEGPAHEPVGCADELHDLDLGSP